MHIVDCSNWNVYFKIQLRVLERNMTSLTPLHLILLEDLVELSVSAYSEVFNSMCMYILILCFVGTSSGSAISHTRS